MSSFIVSARKYRPQRFEDSVSQRLIIHPARASHLGKPLVLSGHLHGRVRVRAECRLRPLLPPFLIRIPGGKVSMVKLGILPLEMDARHTSNLPVSEHGESKEHG